MIRSLDQRFGDFRLVRQLSSSSFAEVYEAEPLQRPDFKVAVKLLKGSFTPQQIEGLRGEAYRVSALEHPYIAPLYTFGVERNFPYLVMSYAYRGALDKLHPYGSRLTLQEIVSYVHPISHALQYAHQRHIVHQGLKPANLLFAQDGRVQVSDFGIGIIIHSSNPRNVQEIISILAYMAPEQFQGQAWPATDQYALAIMVYQWLSGTLPFDGNGNSSVLAQQQMG